MPPILLSPAFSPPTAPCPPGHPPKALPGVSAGAPVQATAARAPHAASLPDAVVLQRFQLAPPFLAKLKRITQDLGASGTPARQMATERLAYRRHHWSFFHVPRGDLGHPAPSNGKLTPRQAASLWLRGDVCHLAGDFERAKHRWRAAEVLSGRRSPRWQDRLLNLLVGVGDDPHLDRPTRALAQLHVEQLRSTQEPLRWFSRRQSRALQNALSLDPLLFLARYKIAAAAYIRKEHSTAWDQFQRATQEFQGLARKPLPPGIDNLAGDKAAVWHASWQWLAHAWPHEPLFVYAAASAAVVVCDHRGALAHERDTISLLPNCVYAHQALAQTLTLKGDYDGAMSAWWTSITLGHDHPTALRALGALEAQGGDLTVAQHLFDGASHGSDSALDAALNDATACMEVGALSAALIVLLQVLERFPNDSTAVLNASTCLRVLERPDEALSLLLPAYARAQAQGAVPQLLVLNLARTYADLGRISTADEAFTEAAAQAPEPLAVHLEAGRALNDLDAYGEARRHFEAALRLQPEEYEHVLNIAVTHLNEHNHARALSLLLGAAAPAQRAATHHYFIAVALRNLGQIRAADVRYVEAVRAATAPGPQAELNVDWLHEAVKMLLDHGYMAVALVRAQAFLEIRDDSYLHMLCSRAAYLQEQWDLTCTHALRCVALNPRASDPWRLLYALPEATAGRPPSLDCLMHLSENEPDYFEAHWVLALRALEAEMPDVALNAAKRAVVLNPGHDEARATLATARERFDALDVDVSDALHRLFSRVG